MAKLYKMESSGRFKDSAARRAAAIASALGYDPSYRDAFEREIKRLSDFDFGDDARASAAWQKAREAAIRHSGMVAQAPTKPAKQVPTISADALSRNNRLLRTINEWVGGRPAETGFIPVPTPRGYPADPQLRGFMEQNALPATDPVYQSEDATNQYFRGLRELAQADSESAARAVPYLKRQEAEMKPPPLVDVSYLTRGLKTLQPPRRDVLYSGGSGVQSTPPATSGIFDPRNAQFAENRRSGYGVPMTGIASSGELPGLDRSIAGERSIQRQMNENIAARKRKAEADAVVDERLLDDRARAVKMKLGLPFTSSLAESPRLRPTKALDSLDPTSAEYKARSGALARWRADKDRKAQQRANYERYLAQQQQQMYGIGYGGPPPMAPPTAALKRRKLAAAPSGSFASYEAPLDPFSS